jgi:hypothetical protein
MGFTPCNVLYLFTIIINNALKVNKITITLFKPAKSVLASIIEEAYRIHIQGTAKGLIQQT